MRNLVILFLVVCTFSLTSCDQAKSDPDGLWGDVIKFNRKEIKFEKSGGNTKITTKGDFWWISSDALIDGKLVVFDSNSGIKTELGKIKGWDNPCVIYDEGADMEIKKIEGPWFTIIKDTYNSLTIITQPNRTGLSRSLRLNVQAGNYFDGLNISQSE